MHCKSLLVALSVLVINHEADGSQETEALYQKINETISASRPEPFSKRVDCIMRMLESENVAAKINQTSYELVPDGNGGFEVIFVDESAFNADLQASLDGAIFSCTVIAYCVIILIVSLLLVICSCVSCLSKRK